MRATKRPVKAIPTDDPHFGTGSIRVDESELHPRRRLASKALVEIDGRLGLFQACFHHQGGERQGGGRVAASGRRADVRSSMSRPRFGEIWTAHARRAPGRARTLMRWFRSPTLLKLFVGQHILNGLSVGAIVIAVSMAASASARFRRRPARDARRDFREHQRLSRSVARQGADRARRLLVRARVDLREFRSRADRRSARSSPSASSRSARGW